MLSPAHLLRFFHALARSLLEQAPQGVELLPAAAQMAAAQPSSAAQETSADGPGSVAYAIRVLAPRFANLCAAHIDSELKLQALVEMIQSDQRNTVPVRLYISFSGSRALFDRLKATRFPDDNTVKIQPYSEQRLSQFEHFKRLADVAHDAEWYFFTDADDLVSHQRNDTLLGIARRHSAALADQACFYYDTYRVQNGKSAWPSTWHEATDSGISTLIGHCDKEEAATTTAEGCGLELWKLVVRRVTFTRFLQDCPPWILHHVYCDAYFNSVMRSWVHGGSDTAKRVTNEQALYFYRQSCKLQHARDGFMQEKETVSKKLEYLHARLFASTAELDSDIIHTTIAEITNWPGASEAETNEARFQVERLLNMKRVAPYVPLTPDEQAKVARPSRSALKGGWL